MNYTLNQLQIFLKITQTLSITKASEELHLTQPAVSIQLKNFQAQFDIPLTEIVGRQIYITDFGKEIAESAKGILNQVAEINYKTSAFKGKLHGKLKIAVVSTGKYVMPYFLSDFINAHSEIELIMDVTNKQKVIESLENNEVDFALVSVIPPTMNCEKMNLLTNNLYLIGGHEYQYTSKIKKKIIAENIPLIFREEGSATLQAMQRFIQSQKWNISKKMELTSNEAVKQAVIAGMGCSIMPLIGLKNELMNGDVTVIPTKGLPIQTDWSLIWMKGKKHSPLSTAYLKYLENSKEEIINSKFGWYINY